MDVREETPITAPQALLALRGALAVRPPTDAEHTVLQALQKQNPEWFQPRSSKIVVAGKTLDLLTLRGFTLSDKIALKKIGIELHKLNELSPESETELVLFTLRKLDAGLERKDVEALSLGTAGMVLTQAGEATKVIDRPT